MKHEEKDFLDLLQEYKSEDTKKARRNLSAIAFVIIAIHLLGIRISDIKVFGVDVSKSSNFTVSVIALALLLYWLLMFILSWNQDREIQRERTIILGAQIKQFTGRFEQLEQERQDFPATPRGQRSNWYQPLDYSEVKAATQVYQAQQARTKRAALYGKILSKLELYIPLVLAAGAALALVLGVCF